MRTLEAVKKLAKKLCSTAADADLDKIVNVDEVLNYIATKYDFSGGGGGGTAAVNLLQQTYTINREAGVTEGDMVNLGYALGLEEGKQYTVKYKFNDADIVATAKYEAPTGLPLDGGELCLCQSTSDEGPVMKFPITLGISQYSAAAEDYMNAAQNYGFLFIVDKHQITGDMTYSDDENNASIYIRALQSSNAGNAVSIELLSIELAS